MERANKLRTTIIVEGLSSKDAVCTFAEAILDERISGNFGDYFYCVKNGRQVVFSQGYSEPMGVGSRISTVHDVFMSKNDGCYYHHPATWEELRELLKQGWVIGTDRRPGVKFCFPDNGRNFRRLPEHLFVFNKKKRN